MLVKQLEGNIEDIVEIECQVLERVWEELIVIRLVGIIGIKGVSINSIQLWIEVLGFLVLGSLEGCRIRVFLGLDEILKLWCFGIVNDVLLKVGDRLRKNLGYQIY